jgi:DNA-binding response OmpR family regulator
MHGKILVYGNDSTLATTRCLILEKAGYSALATTEFSDAMLVLMNQPIDVLIVCQSLRDEERQGILETAKALKPNIKCVILRFYGHDVSGKDAEIIEGLEGPDALLVAVGKIVANEAVSQTPVADAPTA